MHPRHFLIPFLIPCLILSLAGASSALAQDKGTVDAKPLPPLAKPNDPKLGAKELFARKYLPAAADKPRVVGFYAHGCVRLHPSHAAALYALVERNGRGSTRIEIY